MGLPDTTHGTAKCAYRSIGVVVVPEVNVGGIYGSPMECLGFQHAF